MPIDMKKYIAEATEQLLLQKQIKKLTVKEIVEACNITRQTFYYHFDDIPDLIKWCLKNEFESTVQQNIKEDDMETGIARFLYIALERRPYMEKILSTNYGETVERLILSSLKDYFLKVVDEKHLFPDCTRKEILVTVNFYAYALKGLIEEWDSLNMEVESAARQICRLFKGEMPLI